MDIYAFPKNGISYNDKFYEAVEAAGGSVKEGVFSGRWLLQHLRSGDAVHFHWPAFSYAESSSSLRLLWRFLRFIALLLLVRAKRCSVYWTGHNLLPHDRAKIPFVDVLGRYIVIALCTRVFVHGNRAAQILGDRFPLSRRKLVVIEHGHWIDYYPNTIERDDARVRLGIDAS